ncbi:signal peptidase I [Candidatus Parcubacteria bacterium]|nr:signal peptidase I [Candidatus Parcubacteria bacterium]
MTNENPQLRGSRNLREEILSFIWETVKIVAISLVIIIPIRYYLVQPFFVKGASMEPSFLDGDYLFVDELSYELGDPQRGDVAVFRYPLDKTQFFIKRVIGMPGETVEIKNNKVIIYSNANPNGFTLNEPYLGPEQQTLGDMRTKLDDNEYFVMGDNRLFSYDSRRWGPVNRTLITGRAALRPWPFTRASTISRIHY